MLKRDSLSESLENKEKIVYHETFWLKMECCDVEFPIFIKKKTKLPTV